MKKIFIALILCIVSISGFVSCTDYDNDTECVVFVTKNGKCYHSSASCAGKNSYSISCSNVGNRRPCKKCM